MEDLELKLRGWNLILEMLQGFKPENDIMKSVF